MIRIPEKSVAESAAAHRNLLHGAYLTVVGNLIFLYFLRTELGAPWTLGAYLLGHAVLSSVLAVRLLRIRKRTLSPLAIEVYDFLMITPYLLTLWQLNAKLGPQIDQLFVPKLLAFGLALVTPGYHLSHLAYIAVLGGESYVFWRDQQAAGVAAPAEPWFTAIAFWMAVSLLVVRLRQQRFEHQLVALRTRNALLTDFARMFLRVRDRANASLQTLTLTADLLASGKSLSPEALAGLQRALARLLELHEEFKQYEDRLDWQREDLSLAPHGHEANRDSPATATRADAAPGGHTQAPRRTPQPRANR